MTGPLRLLIAAVLAASACVAGPVASPTPLPAPSFEPLTEADCPIPADIDEGAFRAALCPTLIEIVDGLRGRDVAAVMARAPEETIDCAAAIADDPAVVEEFPQCGSAPPPTLTGRTWCREPVAPSCEILGPEAYRTVLAGLLASADPAATDAGGAGGFTIVGFDPCGGTQVLRASLIARADAAPLEPGRWVLDFFLRRRPLLADGPAADEFLLRRVDAAPLAAFVELSADPLSEGRCDVLIRWEPS